MPEETEEEQKQRIEKKVQEEKKQNAQKTRKDEKDYRKKRYSYEALTKPFELILGVVSGIGFTTLFIHNLGWTALEAALMSCVPAFFITLGASIAKTYIASYAKSVTYENNYDVKEQVEKKIAEENLQKKFKEEIKKEIKKEINDKYSNNKINEINKMSQSQCKSPMKQ